jgi:F0F1-type ATP synthase assembly protein I
VVLVQVGCALLTGAGSWLWKGDAAGLAGVAGGLIVATGSALFGWWMFRPGVAGAPRLASAMFGAVALKWLWFLLALFYALARLKLAPGPLLAGMVIAQVGLWGAMARPR